MFNGHSEGTIELKCYCLDCISNDRTRHESGFGLCHCDDVNINSKGICATYKSDFIFIAYNSKYKSQYRNTKEIIEDVNKVLKE